MDRRSISRLAGLLALVLAARSAHSEPARPIIGCGEKSVMLICRFYGMKITEERVLDLLRPNELGETSIQDLQRCIRTLGLDCQSFRATPEQLTHMRHPLILLFRREAADHVGHFLVAFGSLKEEKLLGYDPAVTAKPFVLTPEKVDKFWTRMGIAVFPKGSRRNSPSLFAAALTAILLGASGALIRSRT